MGVIEGVCARYEGLKGGSARKILEFQPKIFFLSLSDGRKIDGVLGDRRICCEFAHFVQFCCSINMSGSNYAVINSRHIYVDIRTRSHIYPHLRKLIMWCGRSGGWRDWPSVWNWISRKPVNVFSLHRNSTVTFSSGWEILQILKRK